MASVRIATTPSHGATRSSRSVPAPGVVMEPETARQPARQADARGWDEGEAGRRLPLAEVTGMRTVARDRAMEAATHRSGRKFRLNGRLRILPNRVHLRRGFRLRGHIPR